MDHRIQFDDQWQMPTSRSLILPETPSERAVLTSMEDVQMSWEWGCWGGSELDQMSDYHASASASASTVASCMHLQSTPGSSTARLSVCTDFMAQSETHSPSTSCALSQPTSALSWNLECLEASCDVDCTLSLATPAIRKRAPSQMSRSGSPARAAEEGCSRCLSHWPAAPSGSRLIDSSLSSAYQNLNHVNLHRVHEDQPTGDYRMNGTSATKDFLDSGCTKFYLERKDTLSSCRLSVPLDCNSQALNEAILRLHTPSCGPDLSESSWNPFYRSSTNEGCNDEGAIIPQSKALINEWNAARCCAHCGTRKTPLWRNGPLGPKSLCNACGIRYKKVRQRICEYGKN